MSDGGREQELIKRWRERAGVCRRISDETYAKDDMAVARRWYEEAEDIEACADELEAVLASPGSETAQSREAAKTAKKAPTRKELQYLAAKIGHIVNGNDEDNQPQEPQDDHDPETCDICDRVAMLIAEQIMTVIMPESASPGSVSDQGWRDKS